MKDLKEMNIFIQLITSVADEESYRTYFIEKCSKQNTLRVTKNNY